MQRPMSLRNAAAMSSLAPVVLLLSLGAVPIGLATAWDSGLVERVMSAAARFCLSSNCQGSSSHD